MYIGISELFRHRANYCELLVCFNKCKWWQFKMKKELKGLLDFAYTQMYIEVTRNK